MWLEKVWNPCPRELVKKHEVLLPWQRFLKVVACRKFKPRAKNIPAVESLACQHTHVWTWHTRNTRVCERDTPGTSTWRQTRAKASQTAQSKMFENVKIADKKENGSDQLHRHIGVRGGKCKRVYRRHTYQHTNISATRVSTHEYIGDTPQHTETTDTIPATGDLLARHKRYQQHNCKNVEEIYGRGGVYEQGEGETTQVTWWRLTLAFVEMSCRHIVAKLGRLYSRVIKTATDSGQWMSINNGRCGHEVDATGPIPSVETVISLHGKNETGLLVRLLTLILGNWQEPGLSWSKVVKTTHECIGVGRKSWHEKMSVQKKKREFEPDFQRLVLIYLYQKCLVLSKMVSFIKNG